MPKFLVPTFAGRAEMIFWCRRLERMRLELARLSEREFCRELDCREVMRDIESARVKVLKAAPFCQCDCPAYQKDCPKCKGSRWISVEQFQPESLKP